LATEFACTTDPLPNGDAILFRSDDLLVRSVGGGGGALGFITFDSYTDHRTLDRPGFAEAFLQSRGIDAVHVISRDNQWYQHPELVEVLAVLAAWSARYERVVSYGSSMGGFAALRFGAEAGAHTGLALSPQFSVDPNIVPFESRWSRDVEQITFQVVGDRPLPIQYIVYDPRNLPDARHAALFAERSPTIAMRATYGGHPAGAFVNETGLLEPLIHKVAANDFTVADAREFERELHSRRRRSGQYLFTLAQRMPPHRLRQKVRLAEMAVEAHPNDTGYLSFYAATLDEAERYAEAWEMHSAAVEKSNGGPYPSWRMILHLRTTGKLDEAERMARKLAAASPEVLLFRQALDAIDLDRRRKTMIGRWAYRLGIESLLDLLDGRRARLRNMRIEAANAAPAA
jgi:hypothetical protein